MQICEEMLKMPYEKLCLMLILIIFREMVGNVSERRNLEPRAISCAIDPPDVGNGQSRERWPSEFLTFTVCLRGITILLI